MLVGFIFGLSSADLISFLSIQHEVYTAPGFWSGILEHNKDSTGSQRLKTALLGIDSFVFVKIVMALDGGEYIKGTSPFNAACRALLNTGNTIITLKTSACCLGHRLIWVACSKSSTGESL